MVVAPLLATPFVKVTAGPKLEPFILNCTVPVGVPEPGATTLTVAVNITDWPEHEGFTEEVTAVAVFARFTVCVKLGEVLVLKVASPL